MASIDFGNWTPADYLNADQTALNDYAAAMTVHPVNDEEEAKLSAAIEIVAKKMQVPERMPKVAPVELPCISIHEVMTPSKRRRTKVTR